MTFRQTRLLIAGALLVVALGLILALGQTSAGSCPYPDPADPRNQECAPTTTVPPSTTTVPPTTTTVPTAPPEAPPASPEPEPPTFAG